MKKNTYKTSIAAKTSLIAFFMIVLGTVIIGIYGYISFRNEVIAAKADEAKVLAQSVARAVDAEQYGQLVDTREENAYWESLQDYFTTVKGDAGVAYLFSLSQINGGQWMYVVEGLLEGDVVTYLGEIEAEDGAFPDEAASAYANGEPAATGIYDSEGYGAMVSGFAPIIGSNGSVLGIVGADISVDEVNQSAGVFGIFTIAIIVAFSIAAGLFFRKFLNKSVGGPVRDLSRASEKIAKGDMDISLNYTSEDEIGILTRAFHEMAESTQKQIAVLEAIADGDLTVKVAKRSDADSMSEAMRKMVYNLRDVVGRIMHATDEVLAGSEQLASGAGTLAQGSVEQAASVAELSSAIGEVSKQTGKNADMADTAARLSGDIKKSAQTGAEHMGKMKDSVDNMKAANEKISNIIKTIEDIAFQTNILALNAAIESARAGESGKGFAVVADEVRNLAAKSAEAAKRTGDLINNSVATSEEGVEIAEQTADALADIVGGVEKSNEIILEIAEASKRQNDDIEKINTGIEQVSQVVQHNSATAEESSAASQQMNGQSEMLKKLVERFRIE